jgi:hypothetical protein
MPGANRRPLGTSANNSRLFGVVLIVFIASLTASGEELPKISIAKDGKGFQRPDGKPFIPFGVTYYRPGTGWAPQVWKKFDAAATRKDLKLMKEYGVNCARVFLSYGSFCNEPRKLHQEGLAKFDQLLAIAEETGIYIHPTGPDHWEGTPEWTRKDRIADEQTVDGLSAFWSEFAARYRGRSVIFAYDLRNEPEVSWDNEVMRRRWAVWVKKRYRDVDAAGKAWGTYSLTTLPVPSPTDEPRVTLLRDYQDFREDLGDEWTARQVAAIRKSDPEALVTVGLIQWSIPTALPRIGHYSGFNPARQARLLDFLEIHFYPLANGAYEYRNQKQEEENLAYLQSVVREVAYAGKPVVVGEFGWYGGGQPTFDQGKHPAASENQQAEWCRKVIETTSGVACGWLNWGFYDQPEATDVSQLTGLLKADGQPKEWGRIFRGMAGKLPLTVHREQLKEPPPRLDWEKCRTSGQAGAKFRQDYLEWFRAQY